MSDECELRIANLSKTERIKESLKAKDAPESESEMDDVISAVSDFNEAVRSPEVPDRPSRIYARDTSSLSSGDSSIGWTMPVAGTADDDSISEVDDDE